MNPNSLDRYVRQIRFTPLSEAGQQRLSESSVLLCGCGALGTVIAETLVRAGVGRLRIVDRDFLETNNLQRQVLFDESDVANQVPKAVAACNKLRQINSTVEVEPVVADLNRENIAKLAEGVQIILDGTDNFDTRFLINDYAIKNNVPWVYGGCIGAEGQTMTILPGQSACLRCFMPEPPPPGATQTCDTAGIVAPASHIIASLQAMEAIKILSGNANAVNPKFTVLDLWENRSHQIDLTKLHESGNCPTCNGHEYPWLEGDRGSQTAVLCGRNSVQLKTNYGNDFSLEALADQLEQTSDDVDLIVNEFLLRLTVEEHTFTVFTDGRVIVSGTDDPTEAKTLCAKFIGM